MNKATYRVAELATIIYAFLVFLSLILNNAYYSQFNIPIVSYMSAAEILLSCIQQLVAPGFLLVLVVGICYLILIPIVYRMIKDKPQVDNTSTNYDITAKYNTASALILILSMIVGLFIHNDLYSGLVFGAFLSVILYAFGLFPNVIPNGEFKRYVNQLTDKIFRRRKDQLYAINYKYRKHIFVLACFMSMFYVFLMQQYSKAEIVKENGSGICVILKGNGIDIDTREGNIIYIGECANNIFLYDQETKGTIIYERAQIQHYKLIIDYIAKAYFKYDRFAELLHDSNRHVNTNLLQHIIPEAPLVDIYTVDIPDNFVLTHHDNNYFVWEDSTTHSYIEQLNIPKSLFDHLPKATEIFDLDIYVEERRTRTDNFLLCSTTTNIFNGKNGEFVQTIIGDGEHYTAWLFYDETGQQADIANMFSQSIRLKGNVWQQMAAIYQANRTFWMIVLIILGLSGIVKGFSLSSSSSDSEEEKNKPVKKKFNHTISWIVMELLGAGAIFTVIMFILSTNRSPVILTFIGLSIVMFILCIIMGILLSPKKDTSQSIDPITPEKH